MGGLFPVPLKGKMRASTDNGSICVPILGQVDTCSCFDIHLWKISEYRKPVCSKDILSYDDDSSTGGDCLGLMTCLGSLGRLGLSSSGRLERGAKSLLNATAAPVAGSFGGRVDRIAPGRLEFLFMLFMVLVIRRLKHFT